MSNLKLKQVGSKLILLGLVALLATTAMMIAEFQNVANVVPSELANGIQPTLIPSMIGMPLLLAGVVMFLLGWFRTTTCESGH